LTSALTFGGPGPWIAHAAVDVPPAGNIDKFTGDFGRTQAVLEQMPIQNIAQLLAHELESEESRASEKLVSFYEYQDVADWDCNRRLFYILNETGVVRDKIRNQHASMLGIMGIYMRLLRELPEENTWIWIVARAHERVQEVVHTYFARVKMLSLEDHQCLFTSVRTVVLDAVAHWKQLRKDLAEMQWKGFAYGTLANTSTQAFGHTDQKAVFGDLLDHAWSGNLIATDAWISNVLVWFEDHTAKLYTALVAAEERGIDVSESGATRMHHQDEQGSFITYEFLRRKVFGQWALDKGLLRGLLRHVWRPPLGGGEPITVADFGAGGGQYCTWLNETGLVQAYAFDGTDGVAEITGGAVQQINLVSGVQLWRNFDWVMCLEVAEHIPKQYAHALLQNLKRHSIKGLVMSWSDDWEGIGHVNCIPRDEFVSLVQAETGFSVDFKATEMVRQTCEIDYIARTIAVFRAPS